MVDGLRLVWDVKVLRTLALIDLAMTGLYLPMESVLFPKYFTERNEPTHDSRIAQGGPIVDGNEGMSLTHRHDDRVVSCIEAFRELTQSDRRQIQLGIRRASQEKVCGAVVVTRGSLSVQVDEKRRVDAQPERHCCSGGVCALRFIQARDDVATYGR